MSDGMSLPEIIMSLTDHTTHADRPFSGQSHTCFGKRGKTKVCGIRFRDLSDCLARSFVHCCPNVTDELRTCADNGTLNYNDLYDLNLDDIDPVALIQCLGCEVEKVMGIYPNVPHLEQQEPSE